MHILLYKRNHLIESSGGAEKIMISYANEFAAMGHKVTLATRDAVEGNLFFPLSEQVIFKHFRFKFSCWRRFIGKIFEKIKLIQYFPYFNRELAVTKMISDYCNEVKPDVVIVAGIQELIDFTAYGKRDYPVIMMMHGHPDVYFTPKRIKRYVGFINNAAAIQVLLQSYVAFIPPEYKGNIVAVGNPVPEPRLHIGGDKVIIYMARIDNGQKRQHLLIEAFALIAKKHPDWQVHFYGDRTNKDYAKMCEELIDKYDLRKQIIFKGITTEPMKVLEKAEICGFPSIWEGFSLALTEAMSVGLPSIGFDYCPSVNELIKDGENGFLVNDVKSFAEKLELLICDENLRKTMGENAQKICQSFTMKHIMEQWLDLINQTIMDYKNRA